MGTRFEMIIPRPPDPVLEALAKKVEQQVLWWHRHLSRFEEESDLSRVNREAALHPVEVDEKVFAVLEECGRYHSDSGGLFDPAILAVQDYWKEAQWEGDPARAGTLAARSGWRQVHLDPQHLTVRFATPETGIDPGAFGKGLALREATRTLQTEGIEDALLSFGGSSLMGLGRHPHGPHWPAGITHIFRPHRNVYIFPLNNTALSSSGASAQRTPAGSQQYLPIFHPRTGMPVQGWKTVSVMTPDPLEAEVLSTALLTGNKRERKRLLGKFKNILRAIEVIYLKEKANVITFDTLT